MLLPVPVEIVWEAKAPWKDNSDQKISAITQKLLALNTGMTEDELSEIVRFAEYLKTSNQFRDTYLRKEDTTAPRTVEIDPTNKRIFIHLKCHNLPEVGRGSHKRVTYSILYDSVNPKLVATAVTKDDQEIRDEIALYEIFRGSEGILEPIYVSKHPKKNGKMLCQIITPLYNKGSLNSLIKNHPKQTPISAKIKIAKDILIGSSKLNAMGYVNRDNNKGNFFIHEENNVYSAIIGDLGGYTHTFKDAYIRKPLGPSLRSSPPDLLKALYENRLTDQDLLSEHVYSLGRSFYLLLHEEEVPWIETFDEKYPLLKQLYKDKSSPEIASELERYTQEVNSHTKPRMQELLVKIEQHTIEPKELFEYCVLQMLSPDPELRKTNAHWLKVFEAMAQHNSVPIFSVPEGRFINSP